MRLQKRGREVGHVVHIAVDEHDVDNVVADVTFSLDLRERRKWEFSTGDLGGKKEELI